MSTLYKQVIACFDRDPDEAMETYSPDTLFDYLGVDEVFEAIKVGHLDILTCLIEVAEARGGIDEDSCWQLIASGVAQHQAVTVLEKYGCNLPLGPYLRECIPPFKEEFFTILPQYVSPSVIRASREDISEYFDMVQQKELLTEQTKDLGSTSKRKL